MSKKKKKPELKVTSLGGKKYTVTTGRDDFLDLSALPKATIEMLRSEGLRNMLVANLANIEIVLCQLRDEKEMRVVYFPDPTFNPNEDRDYYLNEGMDYYVKQGNAAFALFHAKDEEELAYLIREVAAIKRVQHEQN